MRVRSASRSSKRIFICLVSLSSRSRKNTRVASPNTNTLESRNHQVCQNAGSILNPSADSELFQSPSLLLAITRKRYESELRLVYVASRATVGSLQSRSKPSSLYLNRTRSGTDKLKP